MKIFFACIAIFVVVLLTPLLGVAQTPFIGAFTVINTAPKYKTDRAQWSFAAEVAYFHHDQVHEICRMTFLPGKIAISSWVDDRPTPQVLDLAAPPSRIYIYSAEDSDVVWRSLEAGKPRIFRPAFASCLQILKSKIADNGEQSVRLRYGIPSTFPLTDYAGILSERFVGGGEQARQKEAFGSNFLENGLPSGFGAPPLMFRLTVFTEDALQEAKIPDLQLSGHEKIAGFLCVKYTSVQRSTSFWVEPKTKIVLRQETRISFPQVRGSRMPPEKPFTRGYAVRKFRLVKNAKPTHLTFPADAVVELPEMLYDMPLPNGVKRQHPSGFYSRFGLYKLGLPLELFH